MLSPCLPVRAAALATLLASGAALAGEVGFRSRNLNLDEARRLVAERKHEEALAELALAEALPGNTNRHLAEVAALRATALQGLERGALARAALVELWHLDPDGGALSPCPPPVRELAAAVRAERPLVLHERIVTARTGRPVRVRARLTGPAPAGARLVLAYAIEGDAPVLAEDFARVPLEAAGDHHEGYLRPGVGGVPLEGEHVVRYFLEAQAPDGTLLDSNGTAERPIRAQLSATRPEGAGLAGADAIVATLATIDEGGHPLHAPPPPPPPPAPWYRDWRVVGPLGGALVAGAVVAAILLQPRPQPAPGSLGRVDLP